MFGSKVTKRLKPIKPFLAAFLRQPAISQARSLFREISSQMAKPEVDLVISPNEIAFTHGTGVLLTRLLEEKKDIIIARSRSTYGVAQTVSACEAFQLSHPNLGRDRIFAEVLQWVTPYKVRSILCVPYFDTDVSLAIAAKAITGAPLGLWLMDDNALIGTGISRSLLDEAMAAASAVFAISPELRGAYVTHYRRRIWVLPPLVSPKLFRSERSRPLASARRHGVMIGNIWSRKWLDDLRAALKSTNLRITWFASNIDVPWLDLDYTALRADGIDLISAPQTDILVKHVTRASFVVVPTDDLNDTGSDSSHRTAIGRYSLPTRLPFVVATSGTPILVVGSGSSAAAQFVKRFDLGEVVPYDGAAIENAVTKLLRPAKQKEIRERSFILAPKFSFDGIASRVFNAICNDGRFEEARFEELFKAEKNDFSYWTDPPVPRSVFENFRETYEFAERLKCMGYYPDFVLDVGASTGIWSHYVAKIFPNARFVLCDPLFSKYSNLHKEDGFVLIEAAISNTPGKAVLKVSSDLYGSSLVMVTNRSESSQAEVPVRTVDEIVAEQNLSGQGLLKVDVQFAEHLVIEGARHALTKCIDVVILELTLVQISPETKTLLELSSIMDTLGFRIFDQVGTWRSPSNGMLEQVDLVFVRKTLAAFNNVAGSC